MMPETLSGLSPEMIGLVGTLVGVFGTKLLDGAVALFKSTVTTPMRLKTLEEHHILLAGKMDAYWLKYHRLDAELRKLHGLPPSEETKP